MVSKRSVTAALFIPMCMGKMNIKKRQQRRRHKNCSIRSALLILMMNVFLGNSVQQYARQLWRAFLKKCISRQLDRWLFRVIDKCLLITYICISKEHTDARFGVAGGRCGMERRTPGRLLCGKSQISPGLGRGRDGRAFWFRIWVELRRAAHGRTSVHTGKCLKWSCKPTAARSIAISIIS